MTNSPLGKEIERAQEPAEAARMAHRLLTLTAEEIATATGADPRTVRRWWNDSRSSSTRYRRQLDDLRAIAEILSQTLKENAIGSWLRSRNRYLKYERPLDALGRGEFDQVREAAFAYVEGAGL
jgi:transcriptional regulator with XRE-family HTH domain